jgi:hypothetical protein
MLVGAGLGLTMISPISNAGMSVATVTVSAAIWLIVVQWLSALLGGYVAGRLRTKWGNLHTDEVFFRDTAHGFPRLGAGDTARRRTAEFGHFDDDRDQSSGCFQCGQPCRYGRNRGGRIRGRPPDSDSDIMITPAVS